MKQFPIFGNHPSSCSRRLHCFMILAVAAALIGLVPSGTSATPIPGSADAHGIDSAEVAHAAGDSGSAAADADTTPVIHHLEHDPHPAVHQADTEKLESHGEGEHHSRFHAASEEMSRELPMWTGLPFLGILLSIAFFPLFAPHWWHHHFPKVSAFWALLFAIPFLFVYQGLALYELLHIYLVDYIPFIILLWGLYTVSGGILISGSLVGTPALNLRILVVGTILASWMGTTGASMLLIRPLLRANAKRKSKVHIVVFFIILVSNIGGSLTPLGDPPLFLGFLHGVPFFWTFNIMPHFLLAAGLLLVMFYIIDTFMYRREGHDESLAEMEKEPKYPVRLEGVHNFMFLGGILGAVLMSGTWRPGSFEVYGVHMGIQNVCRDILILLMGLLALKATHHTIRERNEFDWFPIKEVAYLFAGIFITIVPMLAMLRAGGDGALGFIIDIVKQPIHYFWITGVLSSFLDNAPTYLTFFHLALGRLGMSEADVASLLRGLAEHGSGEAFISYLKGISAGAVFFGAMTYIGNAPNFMVRSISEQTGVKMPSFFGYMLWSLVILVPTFIVVTLVFF